MKNERVLNLLSLGANLAVLAGLVFVGLQVRDGRAAAEAQVADGIAEGFLELSLVGVSDPAVACIVVVGLFHPEDLKPVESARFSLFMRAVFNQYERVFRLHQTGLVRQAQWDELTLEIAGMMATPGGKLFLTDNTYPDDFVAAVPTSATPLGFRSWTLGTELPRSCGAGSPAEQ